MTKKRMRGFTSDGFVKVQRTVLRRVVIDRFTALLNGDFIQRNKLSENDYDTLINEINGLNVMEPKLPPPEGGVDDGGGGKVGDGQNGSTTHATLKNDTVQPRPQAPLEDVDDEQQPPPKLPTNTFSSNLETFIQLIAASIMIDASMRGENAGESDTRFIKKKKKILVKTIQGPKLFDFKKEVMRFDMIKRGEEFEDEEIVESEESKSSSSESESESEEEEFDGGKHTKKKAKYATSASSQQQPPGNGDATTTKHVPLKPPSSDVDEDSSEEEESMSITSGDATSSLNENSTLDGFSTSAASSSAANKHNQKKKEKKRLKKEKKRIKKEERKRIKKERKRKEKEERRKKRKLEKDKLRKKKLLDKQQGKKKKKHSHHPHHHNGEDDELPEDIVNENEDESMEEQVHDDVDDDESGIGSTNDDNMDEVEREDDDDEPTIYEIATKEDFDKYKEDLLSRVPKSVKSRFRQGGFSRWGKDWLPILELGPFDVEPGPVRDMWLDMFDNTQESGRDMTRLVFWYGVKYEERGQAYSFVPETKIIPYEEGESKGYCKMPKKISSKVEKKQKLTKTEEQIKRGLAEIVSDMAKKPSDRAAWMMKFKEDYELAEEEAAREEAHKKLKAAVLGDGGGTKKKKLGRPKKGEDGGVKRKPGRPKKVVDGEDDDDDGKVKKKGPGRPKKSDKAKGSKTKQSTTKKWVMLDDDLDSDLDTESDEDDRDYDDDLDSGDEGDMDVDADDDDSDDAEVVKSSGKKRKATTSSSGGKKKKKSKNMTEEERAIERKAKAAEYREKKARERCEAQGLEYVKGRVGRKSKATMLEEEQLKFTKCEEVFIPIMDKMTKAKDDGNAKRALKCINAIMGRVELLTPPFLREYPLGMLVKQVRKSFESVHPEVKERCKSLTSEMKRVYSEKDGKVPEEFEPIKNKKSEASAKPHSKDTSGAAASADRIKSEKVVVKSEKVAKAEMVAVKAEKVDTTNNEPSSIPKQNSEMSLPGKMAGVTSSECLPDTVKSEPKQKKTFSIKGMFEKPKPAPKPKIAVSAAPSAVVSGQPSPKPTPKSLPSWVTGPAMKMEDFHEQHAKERTFGLEFLVDATSSLVPSTKKFDPISVSQSFELAIFAETKLRGRDWDQYWERIHDVVAMLSPGRDKRNAILQGIISGDYKEPSELVKLSRREIQSLNQLSS